MSSSKVSYPINPGDSGITVRNLQEALLSIARTTANASLLALAKDTAFLMNWAMEFQQSVYSTATEKAVRLFQQQVMGILPTGIVDEATAAAINNRQGVGAQTNIGNSTILNFGAAAVTPNVSGTVYDEWIEPMTGAPVMVFDQDIRHERLVGEGVTDEHGGYSISYSKDKLTRQDKGSANLIVKLYSANGDPLFTSPINYNAPPQLQVNINLGPRAYLGVSDFVKNVELIRGFTENLTVAELTENMKVHDLSFLISKTGIGVNTLLLLVAAFRFEKWTGLEAEVYYGILSQGNDFNQSGVSPVELPASVDTTIEQAYIDFWTESVANDMITLQQAATNNIINYKLLKRKDEIQSALQKLQTAPPLEAGATQSLPPVYANLKIAGLSTAQQQAFLTLYSSNGIDTNFWSTLAQDASFQGQAGSAEISQLQAVFQLADWTENNSALTAYIIQAYSIHSLTDFSSLVTKTAADWVQIIQVSGTVAVPAAGQNDPVQALADSIAQNIEQIYPTAVFADRFTKAVTLNISNQPYLTAILQSSDFNLTTSAANQYLSTYITKNPLPTGVSQTTIAGQLMTMQRVYKISQSADTSLSLLGANIQSAKQIYAMGQTSFVNQFQQQLGGTSTAEAIFNQAAAVHVAATQLTGQLISRLNNPAGNFLPDLTDQITQSNLAKNYPDLANLFGMPASYCECKDCKSMLGIPAYLTDILDFLSRRPSVSDINGKPGNAREVLLAIGRRPDIADIDLGCKNANVEVPYIDIVNELLEDYIIPPVACLKLPFASESDAIAWYQANVVAGQITQPLYNTLLYIASEIKTPICNISLLTLDATISIGYITDDYNFPNAKASGTVIQHVIRDKYITLKIIANVVIPSDSNDRSFASGPVLTEPLNIAGCYTVFQKPSKIPPPGNLKTVSADFAEENNILQLIVQEIHETHLPADVITTNPEYTNTNVYNCLGDPLNTSGLNLWGLYTLIPTSLPFDLYFTESNVYLNKMGMKRSDLINTFRDQQPDPTGVYTASINSIVNAYLGLTPADAGIIFNADSSQSKYWGGLAGNPTPEVDLFLAASGLSFTQLQTLLTLKFINGGGANSVINDPPVVVNGYDMANCNTADMTITNMITTGGASITKFDLVNRFLRLWNKINLITTVSMEELDDCIMSAALGGGQLNPAFGINLYYFLQVMSQMSLSATQALVLYQPMETSSTTSLYQQLFLNRQVTNPLVPVFQLLSNGGPIIIDLSLHPEAIPVILTVCSITQADLTAILDRIDLLGAPLNIERLSFIYACGLLSNYLSLSASDLLTFIDLLGYLPINLILSDKAVPATTFNFIGQYNEIQQAGFTVDGIDYIVDNQSTANPSLIPNPDAVVSGLESIRTALQGAVAATTVVPDPQGALLKKWLADPALNWDPSQVSNLMSILGTTSDSDYISLVQSNLCFLQVLLPNYGTPSYTAYLDRLPKINFPDTTIANILYDNNHYFLFFNGAMTALEQKYLNALPGVNTAAVDALYKQSQRSPIAAVPLGLTSVPGWLTTNFQSIQLNAPGFSCGTGVLGFTGNMTGPVYNSLLAQSNDPTYGCALSQLFVQCQNITSATVVYVQLSSLPSISLPDGNASTLAYSNGALSFEGAMSAADALSLLGLSGEQPYQAAICSLFTSSSAGQTVSASLANLPSGWAFIPDLSGISGLTFSPAMLTFSGAMTETQLKSLLAINLSTDPWDSLDFYNASNALYMASQQGGLSAVPLAALPTGVSLTSIPGLGFSQPALCYNGQMSNVVQTALSKLSTAADWATNVASLFTLSQSTLPPTTVPIPALPAGITPAILSGYSVTATGTNLSYTGAMSVYILDLLLNLSTDANWVTAVTALYQQSQNTIVTSVILPLPSDLTLSNLTAPGVVVSGSNPITLAFTGQMTPATRTTLQTFSVEASYQAAIGFLFNQTSAIFGTTLPLIVVPLPDGVVGNTAYHPGSIVFTGTPNPLCNDEFNLEQLNPDPDYQSAIGFLYAPSLPSSETVLPAGTIGVVLHALPPVVFPADIPISWSDGLLSFTGQMTGPQLASLKLLSNVASYQAAITNLHSNSQITSVVTIPALAGGVFPDGISMTDLNADGVTAQLSASSYILSYTGQMTASQENALIALAPPATNDHYTQAIQRLFALSGTIVVNTVPLPALPPAILPAAAVTAGWYYDATNLVLYYQGAYASLPSAIATLTGGLPSTDTDFQAVVSIFTSHTTNPGSNLVVFAPPTPTPFDNTGMPLSGGSTINYQGGTLSFSGSLSFADYVALLSLGGDTAYQSAVTDAYLGLSAVAFTVPEITFPAIFSKQLSFSAATSTLTLGGAISLWDYDALLSFGTSSMYQQAMGEVIEEFAAELDTLNPSEDDTFLDIYISLLPMQNGALTALDIPDRYAYFLNAISPVYQGLKQADALASQLAANFGVTAAVADVLVEDLEDMLTDFTASSFVGNSKTINPDPDQFPLALWYVKLARLSFVIENFNLSAEDTDWLLSNGSNLPNVLTKIANPDPAHPLTFSDWELLNNLSIFQRTYNPQATEITISKQKTMPLSVYSILSVAQELTNTPGNPGALLSQLVQLTGWDMSELVYLLNIGQRDLPNLTLNPLDLTDSGNPAIGCAENLTDATILLRLSACFAAAARLKVVPSRCVNWVTDPLTATTAMDIKQALKSQYPDTASWESAITPLMNTLRQARRDALVTYLLNNKVVNVFGTFSAFPDEFGVYGNFLIDVEMGACQPTTRLIQAYCSVQSFVQRCFLSIEPQVNTGSDATWAEWTWMGTFESWFEVRYVFLYPENFILPQTLPNPSSFYVDLQNDLTQGAVTADIVETAFENYIESLDDIARLQVAGMWYDDPTGNLYVFACTYGGDPAVYYFRVQGAAQQWSPWEQVTADVPAGQVIPVVQNGRLYLYWPQFTQTSDDNASTQPIPTSSGGGTTPTPIKYWQIQMAFSEYINGKWSGKKVSTDFLTSTPITINNSVSPALVYPDTTDYVFIALDIPPTDNKSAKDILQGTQASLRVNNSMAIACFLYSEASLTFPVTVTISGTGNYDGSQTINCIAVANQISMSFPMQSILDNVNQTISQGGSTTSSLQSSAIIFLNSNPLKAMEQVFNGFNNVLNLTDLSTGSVTQVTVNYAVTFGNGPNSTATPNSDHLGMLKELGDNAFLLDPLRGYPTPGNLPYIQSLSHLWFNQSGFDNNVVEGSGPFSAYNGTSSKKILGTGSGLNYSSLLPLQMGLWSKYDTVSSGKVDPTKLGILMPFFYQDTACTFYVLQATKKPYVTYEEAAVAFEGLSTSNPVPAAFTDILNKSSMVSGPCYQFFNFYHPFAHYFIRIVAADGMAGVITRPIQLTGDLKYGTETEVKSSPIYTSGYKGFEFSSTSSYNPSTNVVNIIGSSNPKNPMGYPIEQMDFCLDGSYSQYNWELFFHGVLLSAMQLSQNQQFADADACFHLIFNPSDSSNHSVPHKYWVTKPFFKNSHATQTIDQLITDFITDPDGNAAFGLSVAAWEADPGNPHYLAMARITPYMYTTFMKYLDNLIAWANSNYTQYTMETVNFAIQLYMLALELLGTKPQAIPSVVKEPVCTYNQLESNLDNQILAEGPGYLSDPIVQVENLLPSGSSGTGGGKGKTLSTLSALYFCIPQNEVLLAYWDTVETQLTKIRNCMNIQGQFQPLSPFPNVPGFGNPDDSGIADFGGVLPNYRFSVMIQKATELCNEVKSLGASLLSALEKQDAEGLALLRASQEIAVQQAIDKVKQLQITDAQLGLQNLQNYQQLVNDKITYYSDLVQQGLLPLEQQALTLNQFSLAMQDPIEVASMLAKVLNAVPNYTIGMAGFGGSPVATMVEGGQQFGSAADSFVQYMSFTAQFADKAASVANLNAGYARRMADWNFQLTLANDELTQVNTQIQAAQNKIAIATQDEENQQLLIQNAEDISSFLQNKYTNQQLYSWMVTQLSNVYFQSYQLAYGFAKQAEVCFGYELGITDSSYIAYGYWDSLHKGLLSGEGLMSSLKQMETDYYNLNVREYELTRQISLAQFDPVALLQLKSNPQTGCIINIPEELFDLDYPGHYFRRVKHIAVTIPGVVGPYTPVCLKMTLLSNSVRIDNTAGTPNNYPRNTNSKGLPTNDSRFLDNYAAVQYIATSNGVNDSGLFEMNLNDERYLPFERAGAISSWQLEFPSVYPQFDPTTITDLIIHFGYTSRDGGSALQTVATQSVQSKLKSAMTTPGLVLMRGFSARRDYPTQWYKFQNPVLSTDPQQLVMDITNRFPFFTQGLNIVISKVVIVADMAANSSLPPLYISGTKLSNALINLGPDADFGSMQYSITSCKDTIGTWIISNGPTTSPGTTQIPNGEITDLYVIFYYSLVNNS